MLIVIEGADGCGKDSVADAVAKKLGCDRLNFPDRSSLTGRAIDRYLRGEWSVAGRHSFVDAHSFSRDTHVSALCMQALAFANRLEHFEDLARAALSTPYPLGSFRRSTDLVLGRYWPSGWVYGQLDGLPHDWLELCSAPFPAADYCILLDASAETCMARRAARDGTTVAPELYEGKLDRTKRIVDLYRQLWGQGRPRFFTVDAERALPTVVADVSKLVGATL